MLILIQEMLVFTSLRAIHTDSSCLYVCVCEDRSAIYLQTLYLKLNSLKTV